MTSGLNHMEVVFNADVGQPLSTQASARILSLDNLTATEKQ
jgi:hypothetical protein